MLRRLLTASFVALLVAGALPAGVLAATPVATGQSVTTDEDAAVAVILAGTDDDLDILTFDVVAGPAHGALTGIAPNLTYTPAANYNGPDSFTFTANDGTDTSAPATVSITVNAVNDAPTFMPGIDPVTVAEDSGAYSAIWASAIDPGPDEDDQTVEFLVESTNLDLFDVAPTVTPDGTLRFTPKADWSGTSIVTLLARDNGGAEGPGGVDTSAPVTFDIEVTAVNDAPAPADTSSTMAWGLTWLITLSASDVEGDPVAGFAVEAAPTHGGVVIGAPITCGGGAPNACSVPALYTPDPGYTGPDSFTFTATDGLATSAAATVSITVTDNAAPVCDNASSTGAEDAPQGGNLSCTDAENEELTYSPVAGAANGNVIVTPDGSWGYQPNANFSGTDSFTFRAADANGVSNTATMSITVSGLNDAPVCTGFAPAAAAEDTQQSGTITTCTDVEASALTYWKASDPLHGSATVSTGGTWTYTPAANHNGPDTFTFRANDGILFSNSATVSITVTAVNDAPVCLDDESTGDEDTQQDGMIGTCSDVDGDPLAYTKTEGPLHGTATVSADGSWIYTPADDWNGIDAFEFRASDGTASSGVATMDLGITPVNDAPVCSGTTLSTDKNVPVNGSVGCTDIDLDTLVLRIGDDPSKGTVAPFETATGAFTYTPDLDVIGSDMFTVIANDGTVDSAPATVHIGIANHAPVCSDASPAASEEDADQSGTLECVDDDLDDLVYGIVDQPAHGTLALDPGTGAWIYTPVANYYGPDSFTFKANDGTVDSSSATVSLAVTPVNDLPAATAQAVTTSEDISKVITLTGGDIEGSTLTFAVVTGPAHGQLTGSAPNLTYTPAANYNGADSFTFRTNDGTVNSAPATVSITVTSVNDAPVCAGDTSTGAEDTLQSGTLGPCTDVDGNTLAYSRVANAAPGSVTVAPNGAWTYTPTSNYNGPDGFTFRASDGTANSNTATVSITVTAVNDAPACASDATTGAEDTQQAGTIASCSDIDGDPLTHAKVSDPTHGAVTVGSNGSWTYTPAANYNGPDSFTFRANDGALDSAVATVSITIANVNDAPDARSEASGFSGFPYVAATTTTTLNVLANDTSAPRIGGVTSEPADPITITAVTGAGRGTVSILPGGTGLAYDPRGCLTGDDVFSYTATDGQGLTDTATVAVTVARPGAGGLGNAPITDAPSVGLRSGATIGRTVPVRVSWCGVVKSTSRIKGFRVEQSASAGASWPTLVTRSTTATSSSRSIGTSGTYAWRVRTTDTSSRTGAYRASATAKASIRQETPAASVAYAGAWRTSSASKASGGRMRSATSTSSSVTITVAAGTRQVGIVAPKGSSYGSFKVWVDDAYAGRFSERAASSSYRQMLFVRSVNPGAPHTIVLKPAGNGRVYLDAIVTLQ